MNHFIVFLPEIKVSNVFCIKLSSVHDVFLGHFNFYRVLFSKQKIQQIIIQ